ncbi:MAG: fibrobacter succinogenes major paralogous domain-containing protein [Bacteroidota bacterium]|nr:fibrobacter succinogenes major paralogous domain-containing protein [Bacteroidota bacterium]
MYKLFPIFAFIFLFGCKKDEPVTPVHTPFVYTDSVADIDGNYYHTVTIGSQVWMAENLRTTRYQNGDTILFLSYSGAWSNFNNPGYCFYNNDSAAENIYGKLYNYRAVNDARNICPVGWHIPTYGEWQGLRASLLDSVGEKLREYGAKHWFPPNDRATDVFGFAALPGGSRDASGDYYDVRYKAFFWSSSYYIPSSSSFPEAWAMQLYDAADPTLSLSVAEQDHFDYDNGFSVRCIKD